MTRRSLTIAAALMLLSIDCCFTDIFTSFFTGAVSQAVPTSYFSGIIPSYFWGMKPLKCETAGASGGGVEYGHIPPYSKTFQV